MNKVATDCGHQANPYHTHTHTDSLPQSSAPLCGPSPPPSRSPPPGWVFGWFGPVLPCDVPFPRCGVCGAPSPRCSPPFPPIGWVVGSSWG
jgi:hypothetical protein